MKILQIVKTNRGAIWALNQVKQLKELGLEVITVIPKSSGGSAEKYKECGMELIEGDWSLPITKPWKFFSLSKEIRRTVESISPDIIHLHFLTNVFMCRLALSRDKTPRLFQVPGPLYVENKAINFIERCISTKFDYWAGACKKTCSIYKEKGISEYKVFLAYYGVPNKPKISLSKNILHNEYKISNDAKIVAMVSYFYKPKKFLGQKRGLKGHEDFIDAIKIVMQKYDNIVPVIIGNAWDGSEKYEEKVKKYAYKVLGGKIIFTGYRSDVYDIYPEIDIVVHPSHTENLGGAAESLMLGIPTISSDVGGFPDIVKDGETGYTVPAKSPERLASAVIKMLEDYDNSKQMAKNGQMYVSKLLDIKNTSENINKIYKKIIENESF